VTVIDFQIQWKIPDAKAILLLVSRRVLGVLLVPLATPFLLFLEIMDNDIEMVENDWNQSSGQGRKTKGGGQGEGGADDIIVASSMKRSGHAGKHQYDSLHDNEDYALDPVVSRQNTCFFVSLVSLLIAMTVLVVGKVYMAPTEIDLVGQLHQIEQGEVGIVDGTNNQQQGDSGPGSTGSTTTATTTTDPYTKGRDKNFDVSSWLHDKGRVPPPFDPKDPRYHGKDKGPFGGMGLNRTRLFDMNKWIASKVTLADGKMFEVVEQLHHDPKAFTEGLAFARGELYESTGMNGRSSLRKLDPTTGDVLETISLSDTYFGEGLTVYGRKAIQLTWKHKLGFVYDLTDLTKEPQNFTFTSTRDEGWGLAYSPYFNELAMSDGSDYIHFWDAKNFSETRRIQVKRQNGVDSSQINELEFFHGRLLANIWYQDVIISINPFTGEVDKEYGAWNELLLVRSQLRSRRNLNRWSSICF
jgi:glutamine cyclotransferase